jgi:hypothetical protein
LREHKEPLQWDVSIYKSKILSTQANFFENQKIEQNDTSS